MKYFCVWLSAVAATMVFYLFCCCIFSPILVVLERRLSRKAFSIQKSTNKSRRNIQTMRCSCHNIETLERKTKWFLTRCHSFIIKFKDNEASKMLFKFTIKIIKGLNNTNKQMNSIQDLEKVSNVEKWEVPQCGLKRNLRGKYSAKKLKFKKYRNEKLSEQQRISEMEDKAEKNTLKFL